MEWLACAFNLKTGNDIGLMICQGTCVQRLYSYTLVTNPSVQECTHAGETCKTLCRIKTAIFLVLAQSIC